MIKTAATNMSPHSNGDLHEAKRSTSGRFPTAAGIGHGGNPATRELSEAAVGRNS